MASLTRTIQASSLILHQLAVEVGSRWESVKVVLQQHHSGLLKQVQAGRGGASTSWITQESSAPTGSRPHSQFVSRESDLPTDKLSPSSSNPSLSGFLFCWPARVWQYVRPESRDGVHDVGALGVLQPGHQPGLQPEQLDMQLQEEHGLEPRGKGMPGSKLKICFFQKCMIRLFPAFCIIFLSHLH